MNAYDPDEQIKATHPDPITGEHGAHPAGVALGTGGGAVVGAAMGSVAGPVGAVVGAVVGGVSGALAGKAIAETYAPTLEDAYSKANYLDTPEVGPEPADDEEKSHAEQEWEKNRHARQESWTHGGGSISDRPIYP